MQGVGSYFGFERIRIESSSKYISFLDEKKFRVMMQVRGPAWAKQKSFWQPLLLQIALYLHFPTVGDSQFIN